MNHNSITADEIFELLGGTWQGEGRGNYSTIDPFDYREKLVFTRRDESTLTYDQRMDSSVEFVTSHGERGIISILGCGDLELVNYATDVCFAVSSNSRTPSISS